MIQPLERPFTAITDAFHGNVPDGINPPLEPSKPEEEVIGSLQPEILDKTIMLESLIALLQQKQQSEGIRASEMLLDPERDRKRPPLHHLCAISNIGVVIGIAHELLWEGIGFSIPVYFDIFESGWIRERHEVTVPKGSFRVRPTISDRSHIGYRIYPWLGSILSGKAPFEGFPDSYQAPTGIAVGTLHNEAARQLVILGARLAMEYGKEYPKSLLDGADRAFAEKPHMEFLRFKLKHQRMRKQLGLVAQLISLAIIEEPEVMEYAKEHRPTTYIVDRSFNIVPVDPQ